MKKVTLLHKARAAIFLLFNTVMKKTQRCCVQKLIDSLPNISIARPFSVERY